MAKDDFHGFSYGKIWSTLKHKGASNIQLKEILKQYQQQGKYKIEIK